MGFIAIVARPRAILASSRLHIPLMRQECGSPQKWARRRDFATICGRIATQRVGFSATTRRSGPASVFLPRCAACRRVTRKSGWPLWLCLKTKQKGHCKGGRSIHIRAIPFVQPLHILRRPCRRNARDGRVRLAAPIWRATLDNHSLNGAAPEPTDIRRKSNH